jgi:8-oxo-dGTP diphosphatase
MPAFMPKEVIEVVAAVIERDGEYLLTQRKAQAVLPLLWEFPGGRVEPHESKVSALIREVSGRIGLTVLVGSTMGENLHRYTSYDVHMTLYSCSLPANCSPTAIGVQQVRWVPTDDLHKYEFPPADQHSMSRLLNLSC